MATVAELLRGAREAAGMSQQQVAELTKMRLDRVKAVEDGTYEVFTAPVYIRGFVRTYARLVKADESAVMGALEQELGRSEKFREPPSLGGEHRGALDRLMLRLSRINWRIALPAGFLILVIAVATWVYRAVENAQNADPLAGLEPGTYQPPVDQLAETLPLPPAPR